MTMTESAPTETKRPRGRPCGTYGVLRRQDELAAEYVNKLGGPTNVTFWEKQDIDRAVMLQSIAEARRRHINRHGATNDELIALVRLEELATDAVESLRLPCHKGFNPRRDFNDDKTKNR
jgi:hypothetical protein